MRNSLALGRKKTCQYGLLVRILRFDEHINVKKPVNTFHPLKSVTRVTYCGACVCKEPRTLHYWQFLLYYSSLCLLCTKLTIWTRIV